ncbi:hypothetical protein J6590_086894 [Homalodisca vitripennis]|nr:hypothetical protein J6590_086894 [Homalodisca vitripennis]
MRNGYNQYSNCNDGYRSGGVIVYVSELYETRQSGVNMKSADALKVTVDIESVGLSVAIVAV